MLIVRPVYGYKGNKRGLVLAVLRLGDTLTVTLDQTFVEAELLLINDKGSAEPVATTWGDGTAPRRHFACIAAYSRLWQKTF